MKFRKLLSGWPLILIIFLVLIFFRKFFLKGLLPIPGDIMAGMYSPWIDYFPSEPTKNPLISDIISQIYIWKKIVLTNFTHFNFPLWDKTILSGTPFLASYQPGVFYPLNLFYLFLSEKLAFSWLVVAQSFLALVFTFFYLRELKLGKIASLFGAIVFAFCAFATVWSGWGTLIHAGLWLPLVLLLIEKYLRKPKPLFLGLIALFLSFSVFAGHFQITLFLSLFTLVYSLFRVLTVVERKKHLKTIGFLIFSFFLAILVSSIQLVPTIELSLNSFRGQENYLQYDNFGLLSGRKFFTFLAPDFFGNPTTLNFWDNWNYQESAFYFGILPLFFLGLFLLRKKDKLEWFYLISFLLAVVFIFDNPLSRLVYTFKIPFFSQSFASRGIFLLSFSVSILSAFGFESFVKEKLRWKEIIFLTVPTLILVLFFSFLRIQPGFLGKIFPQGEFLDFTVTSRNLILPIMLILAAWLLFLAGNFLKEKLKKILFWLFILVLCFDLFRFADKYLPFVRPELVFPSTPVLEFLQKQEKPFRIEKESSEILPANMWSFYGLESSSGYNPLYPIRYAEFISVLNTNEVRFDLSRYALVRNFNSQLFDLLNNKYLLALKRGPDGIPSEKGEISYLFKQSDSKFKLIFEDKSLAVLENPLVFPRAFFVDGVIVEKNKEKIAEMLLSEEINLRKIVILEEEVSLKNKSVSQGKEAEVNNDSVEFLNYSQDEEKLKIKAGSDKILFVSETFYPGWKAFLDKEEVKIYRANYAFRAVFIPEGEHELRFVYQPLSFRIGAGLSLLGLALCGFLILKRKKS